MRKVSLFAVAMSILVMQVPVASAVVVATWNFTDDNATVDTLTDDTGGVIASALSALSIGNANGTVADPVNPTSASNFTGASGTGNIGNAMRIGALNTAVGGSGYFELTVTSPASTWIQLTNLDFGARSTSTGAQAYSLRSSADGYATDILTGTIANNSVWTFKDNAPISRFIAPLSSVTFRLFGSGGTGTPTAGTINTRLDDITTSFVVSAVPEASSFLFGGLALCAAGAPAISRRWKARKSA